MYRQIAAYLIALILFVIPSNTAPEEPSSGEDPIYILILEQPSVAELLLAENPHGTREESRTALQSLETSRLRSEVARSRQDFLKALRVGAGSSAVQDPNANRSGGIPEAGRICRFHQRQGHRGQKLRI